MRLCPQALRDLRWWQCIGTADVTRAIWRSPITSQLHTDASRLGWGGLLNHTVPASGMWTGRARGSHINLLELEAVHRSLRAFMEPLQGQSVLLWCDNTTVMHVLNNRTSRSPELMRLLRRVWLLVDSAGITLTVRWIATAENDAADALSRGSPFDELRTRPAAWRELEARFGPHTVDRYAAPSAHTLPRWNSMLPHSGLELSIPSTSHPASRPGAFGENGRFFDWDARD